MRRIRRDCANVHHRSSELFGCWLRQGVICLEENYYGLTDDALLELCSKGFTVETCKLGIDRMHLILFRFPYLLTLLTKEWLVWKKQLTMVSTIERNTTRVHLRGIAVAKDLFITELLVEVMVDVEVPIL